MKIESREGRKKLSVVPMGLNKEERVVPSVKALGYFQFGPECYEMAFHFMSELFNSANLIVTPCWWRRPHASDHCR